MRQTLEESVARWFAMSDATWARHANPWSVWTRFTVLPLLILTIWSRVWLGHWAWLAVGLALLWTWYNPRLFPPPASTDNWASRAVLGERVWLNRRQVPVPERHRWMPHLLNLVSTLGLPLLIYGLVALAIWPTLCGALLVYAGKVWFLDRMVWLYQDMHDANDTYASWLY
jgi:hypothetical protein